MKLIRTIGFVWQNYMPVSISLRRETVLVMLAAECDAL